MSLGLLKMGKDESQLCSSVHDAGISSKGCDCDVAFARG